MTDRDHNLISVVIVDDDDFFRAKIESWLAANPRFTCVASCADGEAAVEEIRSKKPALAIIDFGLPGIKGDEVILRARELIPFVKTIAVTGIPDDYVVFDSLDAGADGFLDKESIGQVVFFLQLEEVLRGGCPLSERARKLIVRKYRQYRPDPRVTSLLSEREREVAELALLGLSDAAIARKLGISVGTVRWHGKNVHYKLGVHSRGELQLKLLGIARRSLGLLITSSKKHPKSEG